MNSLRKHVRLQDASNVQKSRKPVLRKLTQSALSKRSLRAALYAARVFDASRWMDPQDGTLSAFDGGVVPSIFLQHLHEMLNPASHYAAVVIVASGCNT
jgi:hypothetical protein